MVSRPGPRVALGLVVLLAGLALTAPAAGLGAVAVDAQPSAALTDPDGTRATGDRTTAQTADRTTAPDRTGTDGRESRSRGATAVGDRSGTTVNASFTFRRLPERPGVVEVTMRLPETPGVDGAAIEFREEVSVVDATNVERSGPAYEWTGEGAAEVVYRVPINWTYTGNSGTSWTLVEHRRPSIDAGASVEVRERIRVAGEGYVGNVTVLLGDHEVYERRADGQRIRVVVPENVTLRNGPRTTASALARAARSLSIGGRDEVVHVFVTPEIVTEAEVLFQPGFALDGTTLLVDGESEFDVWTHEYVHARQEFPDAGGLAWLTEASAEYYGWVLSVEAGYDDWGQLRGVFARGATDDSVLAEPETWGGETDYTKGAAVLGVLDHEIRVATDGEASLEAVIRRVNADSDPTLATFLGAVRDVGGPDAAAAAERYLTTGATPDYRPDTDRFEAIYDRSSSGLDASARMRTRVLALSRPGPNGPHPFDPGVEAVRVGPGQPLTVRARVTNAGDDGGLATMVVRESPDGTDPTRIGTPWVGWLRPGAAVTRNETVRFDRPGTYEVVWGDRRYAVRVVPDRGTASVTGLNATRNRSTGDLVVEATVRNDGDRPTFVQLPVSVDGRRLRTVTAVLGAGATRTVTVPLNLSRATPYTVSVGSASGVVGQAPETDRPGTGTDADRPGTAPEVPLVPGLAALGVLVLVGGVAWRIVARG